jgi:hypothetical protein
VIRHVRALSSTGVGTSSTCCCPSSKTLCSTPRSRVRQCSGMSLERLWRPRLEPTAADTAGPMTPRVERGPHPHCLQWIRLGVDPS